MYIGEKPAMAKIKRKNIDATTGICKYTFFERIYVWFNAACTPTVYAFTTTQEHF